MHKPVKHKLAELLHSEQGVAYIEFAISITFLLLLFFGAVEISRFMLIIQKVEKTVASVSDVTARSDGSTDPATWKLQEQQLLAAVPDMMAPYNFANKGTVILSDVSQPVGASSPTVNWQTCTSAGATSKIGTPGGTANLTALAGGSGFTMNAGDEIIVGEIFYNYTPILVQSVIQPVQLYRSVVYVPRINSLSAFAPTCP